MNAAIDQQCEYYIKENGLEKEVEAKIAAIYKQKELQDRNTKAIYLKEIMVWVYYFWE
jgi:hypothetical protein